jgi:hypothetical protein
MKRFVMFCVVFWVIVVLSGCGAALPLVTGAVTGAAASGSEIILTVGTVVVGILGFPGDTIPLDKLRATEPELWADLTTEVRLRSLPMVMSVDHAEIRHGVGIVDTVNKCFDQYGAIRTFVNKTTGRVAEICQDGPQFMIRIKDATGDLVTAFMKEKMRFIEQVTQYLINRGYILK